MSDWKETHAVPSPIEGNIRCVTNQKYVVGVKDHQSETLGKIRHLIVYDKFLQRVADWDELQSIKNELCGPDVFAFEVYPPEKYLVNTANARHLWCLMDDGAELPVGYRFRATHWSELINKEQQRVVW